MITITLGQEDINTIAKALDSDVKVRGLDAVKPAAFLLLKLEAAVTEANAPKPEPQEAE